MAQFAFSQYMPITSDGDNRDVFNSQFKNLRFAVPIKIRIQVTAAFAYNAPAIAAKYLGDPMLWWVIVQFNGFYDPREDLYPGQTVSIPDRAKLLSFLETLGTQSTRIQL
jgi:hypothetical protein